MEYVEISFLRHYTFLVPLSSSFNATARRPSPFVLAPGKTSFITFLQQYWQASKALNAPHSPTSGRIEGFAFIVRCNIIHISWNKNKEQTFVFIGKLGKLKRNSDQWGFILKVGSFLGNNRRLVKLIRRLSNVLFFKMLIRKFRSGITAHARWKNFQTAHARNCAELPCRKSCKTTIPSGVCGKILKILSLERIYLSPCRILPVAPPSKLRSLLTDISRNLRSL